MRLARIVERDPSIVSHVKQLDGQRPATRDYSKIVGDRPAREQVHGSWRPATKAARELDRDLYAQERQTQDEEIRLRRDLAKELIDIGYKALATRLHPDRGGSKDAMVRLNDLRAQFLELAKTRRWI
jgi:hypothetical protein